MPFNAQKIKELYFPKLKLPDRSWRDCHLTHEFARRFPFYATFFTDSKMKMALQNASFLYTVFYCFESGSLR
jgi:hypothetical protein